MTDTLASGSELLRDESLLSINDCFFLILQGDGNLVLYYKLNGGGVYPLWASDTVGIPSDRVKMREDGTFGIYNGDSEVKSFGAPGGSSRLVMQGDGNLVVYPDSGAPPTFASGTNQPAIPIPQDIRNALAGIIEGRMWDELSTRDFQAKSSQTHPIELCSPLGCTEIGSYTNEQEFTGKLQDPFDLDIYSMYVRVSMDLAGKKPLVGFDFGITTFINGEAKGKIRNVIATGSKAKCSLEIRSNIEAEIDVCNLNWVCQVKSLTAKISRLKISNDILDQFSGFLEKKLNENINTNDLIARINFALLKASSNQALPDWISQISQYKCIICSNFLLKTDIQKREETFEATFEANPQGNFVEEGFETYLLPLKAQINSVEIWIESNSKPEQCANREHRTIANVFEVDNEDSSQDIDLVIPDCQWITLEELEKFILRPGKKYGYNINSEGFDPNETITVKVKIDYSIIP
ncbi:hypothetical protein H1P_870005 [Hyella patelloides LEGE 07179]|uniref:Bulb-type lectin domain-containing protein n=1 Tax=Hyella patelloides LEGE 07179 TaxID=945734 RepID=A0A563W4S3_9CYAN|nr:hypothetical protein [Hyella patelloides]VEP18702.1 hypothetical protein H1P_870005 [Hyella patelloides LEGE 07179]